MKRAMALATRVECDKESNGFGGKSNGNEGGRRLTATRVMSTAMAMTWVMVMVTRLAGNKEGKGEGGKGDGGGDDGGRRQRGNGDGSKSDGDGDNGDGRAMMIVTKSEGGGRRNGHWQRRQERWQRRNERRRKNQPARLDDERAAQ